MITSRTPIAVCLSIVLICACSLQGITPTRLHAAEREWPFYAPKSLAPPTVNTIDRLSNPIDAFVLQKLESVGLSLAPEADKRTLVRRLYFDLIGLPPAPEQVDAFVNRNDPAAYEQLVDSLLADPRYGERWAKFWLDLARFADTAGYEGDPDLPHAWRYRDYVIDAFNYDKPYDEFVIEQIAGDEIDPIMGAGDLPDPKPEPIVALTFLRLAPFTEPRGDASRHELLSEMTSTVSSVFLGLTVGCAQCHDHKYDLIPTEDFYRMKAFFSTVQIERPRRGDTFQIGGPLHAPFYRNGEKEWTAKLTAERQAELEQARKAGDKKRIRLLEQDLLRLQPLAMSLRHSYGPPYEPGVPETHVLNRGEWDKPGQVVKPGFPSVITGNQNPASIRLDPFKRWPTRSRRLTLAQWIASPENPMTARVMVNRLWGWHFGRGLVATPSDFGKLSGGASHPELIDWLAQQFTDEKWSVKSIHRLILNSATYRQASHVSNPTAEQVDPDNVLLWRFRQRRLEAEAVRDAVLAVSGRLNPQQNGLPIFPPLPEGLGEEVNYDAEGSKWVTQLGHEGRKRSIYIYQQRSMTMPLMQTFDSVVCDGSRDRRPTSTTPLQALSMYNGRFAYEEAGHFAARIRKEAGGSLADQITLAFKTALGREPMPDELRRMEALVALSPPDSGLAAVCRVLLNTNEFVYVR